MDTGKIIPFDIKRKYKSYDELLEEDYCNVGGIVAPLFDAIYVDKYNNTIGRTKSGKEFLIPKKQKKTTLSPTKD